MKILEETLQKNTAYSLNKIKEIFETLESELNIDINIEEDSMRKREFLVIKQLGLIRVKKEI